jgi:DNA-binding MarR family transcriptional regulator
MKREGLINAGRQTNNKRYVNIELTDKGREVANQAIPIAKEIIEQIMSSMTKDDVALLKDELKIVRQNAHHGLTSFTSRYEP